jgi:septal ring factor EnvC (AmiA/AmiB activator)
LSKENYKLSNKVKSYENNFSELKSDLSKIKKVDENLRDEIIKSKRENAKLTRNYD